MLRNPIDAFPLVISPDGWQKLVVILDDWRELDLIIFHYAFGGPPLPACHETITPAVWAIYLGASLGLAAVLWFAAVRRYHNERLAISG